MKTIKNKGGEEKMVKGSGYWKAVVVGVVLLVMAGVTWTGGAERLPATPGVSRKPVAETAQTASARSAAGLGAMTAEEERTAALRYMQSSFALFTGRYMYMLINMRAPESFKDLCNGPYMPVPCETVLQNPYTGAPMRGEPGLGEIWFSASEADQEYGLLQYWFLGKERRGYTGPPRSSVLEVARRMRVTPEEERGKWKDSQEAGRVLAQLPELSSEERARLASRLPLSGNQKRLLALSPRGQRAYVVGYYLWTAVSGFYEYTASQGAPRFPATLSELFFEGDRIAADWVAGKMAGNPAITVSRVAKVAILRNALINEFTGKPAQETNEPSPGNYKYYRASNGDPVVETYDENGVAFSLEVFPAFHRNPYE